MSVLIKGMKMPKGRRGIFVCVCPDGTAIIQDDEVIQTTAIELPPHGRLIDADALFAHMVAVHKKWKDNPELYKTIIPIVDDELIVACFPTMIDAKDGE